MPRKLIKLAPGVARRFVEDMRAYFAETNLIKRDEIAARQLHALREHYAGKLRHYHSPDRARPRHEVIE
jgi:hypothetical protein